MATLFKVVETRRKKRASVLARPEAGLQISGREAFEKLNGLTPKVMARLAK